MQADQFAVQADGRGAGRQAEDGGAAGGVVLADETFDHQREVARGVAAGGKDDGRDLRVRNVVGRHNGP